MKYIDDVTISHKTVLLRVDFNVSLNRNQTIADDVRIRQSLPTIEHLLKHHNKIILIAHLGEPEERDPESSLHFVAKRLHDYIPTHKVTLVDDFLTDDHLLKTQKEDEVLMLENIRFYPGEQANDPTFAKQLAALGDIYVNDAFGVSHRKAASLVGLPALLPSYAGLLMKKEVTILEKLMKHPYKPFVAIVGGKKISTKIKFITKLTTIADYVLLGGGLANTFLVALGHKVGDSIVAKDDIDQARHIMKLAEKEKTQIILPTDVVVAKSTESHTSDVRRIDQVAPHEQILDIGPDTQAAFGVAINKAKTIVWNGPVGYMENPEFKRGTDFLYYAITHNTTAISVLGGGDTLAAINKKEYLNKITHISTGGGAMLEFIENGTLPGIEALKKAKNG
jgi:phosphoglycerate kinase